MLTRRAMSASSSRLGFSPSSLSSSVLTTSSSSSPSSSSSSSQLSGSVSGSVFARSFGAPSSGGPGGIRKDPRPHAGDSTVYSRKKDPWASMLIPRNPQWDPNPNGPTANNILPRVTSDEHGEVDYGAKYFPLRYRVLVTAGVMVFGLWLTNSMFESSQSAAWREVEGNRVDDHFNRRFGKDYTGQVNFDKVMEYRNQLHKEVQANYYVPDTISQTEITSDRMIFRPTPDKAKLEQIVKNRLAAEGL
jgi:hypothetical protein